MDTDLRLLKRLLETRHAGLLLEGFEARRRTFHARLRKARRKPSADAVHNLRVAARRLLAMLALLESVLPARRVEPLRRTVRQGLRSLGGMRDVQVQRLHTETLRADFPQLDPFHRALGAEERRLSRRARRELRDFDLKRFARQSGRLLHRLVTAVDPDEDSLLGGKIEAALEDAHQRVLARRGRIDPGRPGTIHRLRLAFKRFRYMAEIAAPLFGQFSPERLAAMHDFQDRMGAIQDVDTLLAAMMEHRRRWQRTSLLVPENELRRRRQRLIDAFMTSADEVRFFWTRPETSETKERRVG